MSYAIVKASLDPSQQAQLQQRAVVEFCCVGIEEFDLEEGAVDALLGDRAYCGGELDPILLEELESHLSQAPQKFYFNDLQKAQAFHHFLQQQGIAAQCLQGEEQDWNQAWKKHFGPITIGRELMVRPVWDPGEGGALLINPGMGFGTGHHETTFLCLELLDQIRPCGPLLDFGCGSGILGVAAARLGASAVTMVDIDERALANARENIGHNAETIDPARITVVTRENFSPASYPLVVANILLDVLLEEGALLQQCLAPGGQLIVSGLLEEQEWPLREAWRDWGGQLLERRQRGDWLALVFGQKE